jgi:hypothetical protein
LGRVHWVLLRFVFYLNDRSFFKKQQLETLFLPNMMNLLSLFIISYPLLSLSAETSPLGLGETCVADIDCQSNSCYMSTNTCQCIPCDQGVYFCILQVFVNVCKSCFITVLFFGTTFRILSFNVISLKIFCICTYTVP